MKPDGKLDTQPPLLEIRGLRVEGRARGRRVEIVRGVDLALRRGQVMGLIGESGAGKSTIGLAAMGYAREGCRIAGGRILFDGLDLARQPEEVLRALRGSRIAYVAQSAAASFNPAHCLIDQHVEAPVIHGLARRAEAEQEGVALYRRLRLPYPEEIGFRYPHQVSGGQLQRCMTAMAMACRPELIIFDEPTTALDVTTQIEVLAAIRDIVRAYGTAALYITHDLAVVAQMADVIKVLRDGREVEEAETRAMLAAPKADYTRSLWAVRRFARPARPAPAETGAPLLAVEGVTARYGATVALSEVSLEVRRGRTVAVVGESGSGKSTLARVICGLTAPRAGTVRLEGAALAPRFRRRTREELRRVQMVWQMADTALNPRRRVADIVGRPVAFYRGLRGAALRRRVDELLEQIELPPALFRDRFPPELSGGQKQRVGIARALAAEPSLVICDEVTSALDQIVAEGVLRLLDRLQRELGLAYLFITHDLATVRAIADDVVVMKDGRVVEAGPRDEMLRPPHHPYTELLLASAPEMDPDWLTRVLAARERQGREGTVRPSGA